MSEYLPEATAERLAILDATGHAVIATRVDGTIGYWNADAERLYGWQRDEVIGRNIVDVTPTGQSREEGVAIMRVLEAGDLWSGVFRVHDRNGRSFDAAVTDLPLRRSGRTTGIIGVSAENTGAGDVAATLQRFASRRAGDDIVVMDDTVAGMTARVSEPHLVQLFAILLLKVHELSGMTTRSWIAARRANSQLRLEFGIESGRKWLYVCISPEPPDHGTNAVRSALRGRTTTRYGASLVDLAGGKLFARSLPRSGAAFHLFLPVN